jgi:hypothetical protein
LSHVGRPNNALQRTGLRPAAERARSAGNEHVKTAGSLGVAGHNCRG